MSWQGPNSCTTLTLSFALYTYISWEPKKEIASDKHDTHKKCVVSKFHVIFILYSYFHMEYVGVTIWNGQNFLSNCTKVFYFSLFKKKTFSG